MPNQSIRNILMVRERLAGVCLVGFNFGKGGDITNEGAVGLAGGGLYLQEKGASAAERAAVMGCGGSYYALASGDPFAHPYYASLPAAPGYLRWTPAQSAFARRWFPKFVWNRDLSPVADRVICLIDGARRYYVTEFSVPGTYPLGRATNVITPETGLQTNVSTAAIASMGLVVDEFAPVDPAGAIRCPALRGYSGINPPIGGDGRQCRSDMSTGVTPFLGVSNQGPFDAGTYQVAFRVWVEPGSTCQLRFSIADMADKEILVGYAHTPDAANTSGQVSLPITGWGYQDYEIGAVTFRGGESIQARLWPAGKCKGAMHLDSVALAKRSVA
jgi:hypothetical protein